MSEKVDEILKTRITFHLTYYARVKRTKIISISILLKSTNIHYKFKYLST